MTEFQVRISKLSPVQEAKEGINKAAVKLLNQSGFKAEYVQSIVTKLDKYPGYILIG